MPQQINLLTPILLAPKRYFSALAMLQSIGLLVLAGAAASLWLQHRDVQAEVEHQTLLAQLTTERQALTVARVSLPAPADPAAVEQQLHSVEASNLERAQLLRALSGAAAAGLRHSDLMALVARSLPQDAWLTELRWGGGRLELSGATLDTAVLRPWLAHLGADPLLAGQELSALRVDRIGSNAAEGLTPTASTGAPSLGPTPLALPAWSFRVVSAPAPAASAASGVAR
jgi:Tfp pilus assembly protein PilN